MSLKTTKRVDLPRALCVSHVYFVKAERPGRKVALPANERRTQAAPHAAAGAIREEAKKEEARVRRASGRARAGVRPEEVGEGLKEVCARARKAARSLDLEPDSQLRALARAVRSTYPTPTPFRKLVVPRKPEKSSEKNAQITAQRLRRSLAVADPSPPTKESTVFTRPRYSRASK